MAVHDPESSLQEKQQALKIGRQKKIQIIDGQRVEVMTGKFKNYDFKIIGSFKEITIKITFESFEHVLCTFMNVISLYVLHSI